MNSFVYAVTQDGYDSGMLLGVYSTRELAAAAMTAWAEERNAEDVEQEAWAAVHMPEFEPREPKPFLPTHDSDGRLYFCGGVGDSISVSEIPLDAACRYPFQDALDAARAREEAQASKDGTHG